LSRDVEHELLTFPACIITRSCLFLIHGLYAVESFGTSLFCSASFDANRFCTNRRFFPDCLPFAVLYASISSFTWSLKNPAADHAEDRRQDTDFQSAIAVFDVLGPGLTISGETRTFLFPIVFGIKRTT